MSLLNVTALHKYYGDNHVLKGIDLAVEEGEVVAIIGRSGSGKSTFLRTLNGLESIDDGVIEVDGEYIDAARADLRSLRQKVGMVFQQFNLFPHLTVGENVSLPLFERDDDLDRKVAGGIVAEAIDAMHLTLATIPRYPHELSRGQRQRVAIARALVLDPELLVADDATAGVDATVRATILGHLAEVQRHRGFAAFVVSSEIGEVRRLSTRLAVLHRGELVGMGPIDSVLEEGTHPYVRRLAELARDRSRGTSS